MPTNELIFLGSNTIPAGESRDFLDEVPLDCPSYKLLVYGSGPVAEEHFTTRLQNQPPVLVTDEVTDDAAGHGYTKSGTAVGTLDGGGRVIEFKPTIGDVLPISSFKPTFKAGGSTLTIFVFARREYR